MKEVKVTDSLMERNAKSKRADKILTVCLIALALIVLVSVLLNTFVYVRVKVDGSSMENTLYDGNVLSVNKLKSVNRGDIIVVEREAGDWIIKRAIGLGGDTITIENGKVYRNGQELDEPYAKGVTYVRDKADGGFNYGGTEVSRTWVVPDGEVFFLGDNRENSLDSRYNVLGTQSLDNVIGVVSGASVAFKDIRSWFYVAADWVAGLFGGSCTNAGAVSE